MRVKLETNAQDFAPRKAELKQAGYRWDRDNFEWTRAPREQASAESYMANLPRRRSGRSLYLSKYRPVGKLSATTLMILFAFLCSIGTVLVALTLSYEYVSGGDVCTRIR